MSTDSENVYPIDISVSAGGGRNMAMLFGMYERNVQPFLITFADTGGEKPETYRAVESMSRWCEDHLALTITIVRKSSMYLSLEDQALRTKTLPSAAYGWRSCSDKWKIQPQDKFRNNHKRCRAIWADGGKVTIALGYDAGEQRRGEKLKEDAKYRYWFPLKDWGWHLEDCIEAFSRHGLPIPPKSACFYCPSSKKQEVIELSREHPDLFARAIAVEETAENLQTVKGLGRNWKWSELVANANANLSLFPEAPQMNCTCLDAEE